MFNQNASTEVAETDFTSRLIGKFDEDAVLLVHQALDHLQLTVPEDEDQFLIGRLSLMLILDEFNLVVRLSPANYMADESEAYRHPRLLQPIASIPSGSVIIKILPGLHQAQDVSEESELAQSLETDGIDFWDLKLSNIGRLPFKTPAFPKGIPVVIDHDAVNTLRFGVLQESDSFKEAQKAQEELYASLRQAFQTAWPDFSVPPDGKKMKAFWDLCKQHAQEGKLAAGWHEEQSEEMKSQVQVWGDNLNTGKASAAARCYAQKTLQP